MVVHSAPVVGLEIDAVVAGRGGAEVGGGDLAPVVDGGEPRAANTVGIRGLDHAGGLVDDLHLAEGAGVDVVEVERLAAAGADRLDRSGVVDRDHAGERGVQGGVGARAARRQPEAIVRGLKRSAQVVGQGQAGEPRVLLDVEAPAGGGGDRSGIVDREASAHHGLLHPHHVAGACDDAGGVVDEREAHGRRGGPRGIEGPAAGWRDHAVVGDDHPGGALRGRQVPADRRAGRLERAQRRYGQRIVALERQGCGRSGADGRAGHGVVPNWRWRRAW